MKANYTSPEMEILQFSREDIITTSNPNFEPELPITGGDENSFSATGDTLS